MAKDQVCTVGEHKVHEKIESIANLQTKIIINMKRVPQMHQFISRKERKKSKWQKSKYVQLVSKKKHKKIESIANKNNY